MITKFYIKKLLFYFLQSVTELVSTTHTAKAVNCEAVYGVLVVQICFIDRVKTVTTSMSLNLEFMIYLSKSTESTKKLGITTILAALVN